MTDPENRHPNAPHPGTSEEGPLPTENSSSSVNVRAGVEVGAIRYVLFFGLILAILAMIGAYVFGYLPAA